MFQVQFRYKSRSAPPYPQLTYPQHPLTGGNVGPVGRIRAIRTCRSFIVIQESRLFGILRLCVGEFLLFADILTQWSAAGRAQSSVRMLGPMERWLGTSLQLRFAGQGHSFSLFLRGRNRIFTISGIASTMIAGIVILRSRIRDVCVSGREGMFRYGGEIWFFQ